MNRTTAKFWKSTPFRIILPSLASLALFTITLFLIVLPAFERNIMADKRATIRKLTQSAWSVLHTKHNQAQQGKLTREQAQQEAVSLLRSMRYGPEMKDYFWITNLKGRMVMHPYTTQYEGVDLYAYTDPQGTPLFQKFSEVAREKGSGYVRYMWQWKDDPESQAPKVSYVKLFEPWGWVIGTGIYIQDAQEEIAALTRNLAFMFAGILGCIFLLSFYGIWQSSKTEAARRSTEDSLRRERDFTRNLIDTAPSFILLLDREGKVRTANRFAAEQTGYALQELHDCNWFQLCVPDSARQGAWQAFSQATEGTDVSGYINPIIAQDGHEIFVEWYSTVLRDEDDNFAGVLAIGHDITERLQTYEEKRDLEEQLHHVQKLEAVGQLAGGVAHDFNNLLTVVLGNVELLRNMLPAESQAGELADTIEQAAQQGTGITRSLLTFSRKIPVEKKPVNLNQTINETMRMLRRIMPATIEINYQKDDERPVWLNADDVQLQQVLVNLAINARDAMPEGGKLDIELEHREKPPAVKGRDLPDLPQGYARLVVRDTGTGIAPENLEYIFDPFFTTKPRGEGTGLGLSIIHSIVREHDGRIDVQSEPGSGTTFAVILPCMEPAKEESNAGSPAESQAAGQGEMILLAEDHQFIREMLVAALQSTGYRVLQTADGNSLLDTYHHHYDKLHLVILDIELPQKSGRDCLREIRKRDENIPVILMSGTIDNATAAPENGNTYFLRKPFQVAELNRMIGEIIQTYRRTETE